MPGLSECPVSFAPASVTESSPLAAVLLSRSPVFIPSSPLALRRGESYTARHLVVHPLLGVEGPAPASALHAVTSDGRDTREPSPPRAHSPSALPSSESSPFALFLLRGFSGQLRARWGPPQM